MSQILVGQTWVPAGSNPDVRSVLVTDFDDTHADRPVFCRYKHDPGFGFWMPEEEFLRDYALRPLEDE